MGDHTTRSGLLVAAVATLLILVPFVDVQYSRAMMVLFVLAPVLFAAIFPSVWLLAGELLEGADRETTRWAYARIGASSMLAGILGGIVRKADLLVSGTEISGSLGSGYPSAGQFHCLGSPQKTGDPQPCRRPFTVRKR